MRDAPGRSWGAQVDHLQLAWYGQLFEIAFLSKRGNEFQDWFVKIAGLAYGPDFDPVRAYGPYGDFKCDGRRLSTGTIFQCYAPGEIKEAETIAKIEEDFGGAKIHWAAFMREWCFVYNDSRGLPPTVTQHLDVLQDKHRAVGLPRWGRAPLWELVFSLPVEKIVFLFGYAPTLAMLSQVGFAELKPVLDAIAQKQPDPINEPTKPPSPRKVEKNKLSSSATDLLRIGQFKEHLVGQFLSQSAWPETGNRIAKAIRDYYLSMKTLELPADEIFARLRHFIGMSAEPMREAAELAVLCYFFHRCDIFEDPDEPEGS